MSGPPGTTAEEQHTGGPPGNGDDPWEVVIGLEVHAQILSQAKLFSGASAAAGGAPNTRVSLVDAAFPGTLPVINSHCVTCAIRAGLGLGAEINRVSVFDRKHYFYPDLPAGYQISQYSRPIVGRGSIRIDLPDGKGRDIGVTRLHLEQDAGKSIHDREGGTSLVDLNRAGVGLMEIVLEPDLRSAAEATACLAKLRTILRYLDVCDGNMEEGSLRADVNLSVRRPGAPYGTRCEIKNVNSLRHMRQAIAFETQRQLAILAAGGVIRQETRLFDPDRGETRLMRSKEDAHDYRYFPDPDLPPLILPEALVEGIARGMPELPDRKKARFMKEYGLGAYLADVLVAERQHADYFEAVAAGRDARLAANWVSGEVFGALKATAGDIGAFPVTAPMLGELLDMISAGTLSARLAKEVFAVMADRGCPAGQVVDERGLRQLSDSDTVGAIIDSVLAACPDKVAEYRGGREKLFGFFIGRIMRESGGQASPAVVNALLAEKLAAAGDPGENTGE